MAIPKRAPSLEEFLKWPEQKPALEFEYGVVTQKVAPNLHHSALQGEMVELINRFARPRRLARAFPELRTTFAEFSRVPDVAVYTWARLPRDETGRLVLDSFIPPDLAIEIASPGQRTSSLVRRCQSFVENGVRLALLVDPRDESVIVVRPDSVSNALRGEQRIDLGEVLPGFALTVAELFEALH
jgi:Uma2 family endonuclease